MPFKDSKGFNPYKSGQQIPRVPTGEEFPGHVPVTTKGGLFPGIFGHIFPGLDLPVNVPTHGQGMPDPSTGPINPTLGGGIGEQGADNGQSIFDILAQLAMGQGLDTNALAKQAMDIANQQYDPQIAELQREMGIAQGHATHSQQEIAKMYGALQQADKADIPQINQMFAGEKNKINNDYTALQNQVSNAYSDANKQQMDLMKQLNIQAAAPTALAQQQNDQAFFTGQQGQAKQDTMDALQLLQTGADNFSTQGAEIAGLEGNNRQADVMSQLQDYLTQAQGRVGDLTNQKQNAYSTALSQLGQQQQQGTQNQFSNMLQLAKLQMEMQQAQASQNKQPTYRSGPLAASQYLGEADPQNASNLNSFLLQILQGQPYTSGQMPNPVDPTRSTPITPEGAAQIAVQQAAAQGMSPQNQQELYMAMLAYYGRLNG